MDDAQNLKSCPNFEILDIEVSPGNTFIYRNDETVGLKGIFETISYRGVLND